MLPAIEKTLTGYPKQPENGTTDRSLGVVVVYTSTASTLRALREAAALAERMERHITLVVPQFVPYPLPLTSPPVLLDFNERRFLEFAAKSPVPTTVRIYLCRERRDALAVALEPNSLVVIGFRKHWLRNPEKALAAELRRAGHVVVVVETE